MKFIKGSVNIIKKMMSLFLIMAMLVTSQGIPALAETVEIRASSEASDTDMNVPESISEAEDAGP